MLLFFEPTGCVLAETDENCQQNLSDQSFFQLFCAYWQPILSIRRFRVSTSPVIRFVVPELQQEERSWMSKGSLCQPKVWHSGKLSQLRSVKTIKKGANLKFLASVIPRQLKEFVGLAVDCWWRKIWPLSPRRKPFEIGLDLFHLSKVKRGQLFWWKRKHFFLDLHPLQPSVFNSFKMRCKRRSWAGFLNVHFLKSAVTFERLLVNLFCCSRMRDNWEVWNKKKSSGNFAELLKCAKSKLGKGN